MVRTVSGARLATGDILFLLLFIVLPTAIIVSGIWAIIFVRLRPPALRMPASEAASTTAEPAALAAPAPEPTLALVAAAEADPALDDVAPGFLETAAPVLSEREAIASIDPLAADLLFDQPLPPPPAPAPFADRAPTEEMPSVERGAPRLDADDTSDSGSAVTAALSAETTADEQVATDDESSSPEPGTGELAGEPVVPPIEQLEYESDGNLGSDVDTAEPIDLNDAADQGIDAVPDDGRAGSNLESAVATDDDAFADEAAEDNDDEAPADADGDAQADSQARRRGPLRLIPSDDNDPRDRRRARNSGRRAPQLPRSVRRNERGV
jgi:hypothetical protein